MNDKLLNIDNNPKEASNLLNNYFTDVDKNIAKKFNQTNIFLNKCNNNIRCSFDKIFKKKKKNVSELKTIIQTLKMILLPDMIR